MSDGLAKLKRLVKNFEELADTASKLTKDAAPIIKECIQDDWDARSDSYGHKWMAHRPATIKRWGPHPLLELTGAMRASVRSVALGASTVLIHIEAPAKLHQTGTANMVPRPMLPYLGFPKKWRDKLKEQLIRPLAFKVTEGL